MKRVKRFLARLIALLLIAGVGAGYWMFNQLQPLDPAGKSRMIRLKKPATLYATLEKLEGEGVIKSALAARLYARYKQTSTNVKTGTYELGPHQSVDEVLQSLQKPVKRMVRIPETNWSARTANLLAKEGLGDAKEYLSLVRKPSEFSDQVSFALPSGSLEGYLYPDTYDLPPMMTPSEVISRQLDNFERRVWQGLGKPKNLHRAIIIASMVEMEAARDEERPIIAGVIENRLAKNMLLQIDAAINYGIQKWRPLTYADYRNVDSAYNLYRHKGLPPGPICSPTVKSIQAALHPAKHKFLYYVALPSGRSLFAETYAQHLQNVSKRRSAVARGTPE